MTSVYLPRATLVSESPADFIASTASGLVAVIAYSNSPRGRRSSLLTAVVNPSGPHHDSRPALVVHSSQTSSTDARKVRSNVIFGLDTFEDFAVFALSGISITFVVCIHPSLFTPDF